MHAPIMLPHPRPLFNRTLSLNVLMSQSRLKMLDYITHSEPFQLIEFRKICFRKEKEVVISRIQC